MHAEIFLCYSRTGVTLLISMDALRKKFSERLQYLVATVSLCREEHRRLLVDLWHRQFAALVRQERLEKRWKTLGSAGALDPGDEAQGMRIIDGRVTARVAEPMPRPRAPSTDAAAASHRRRRPRFRGSDISRSGALCAAGVRCVHGRLAGCGRQHC